MSANVASVFSVLTLHLCFFYDVSISIFTTLFANLLPTIHVPRKDQSDKTAIVTGANSGIGYYIALRLAENGATVILACRNMIKGEDAAEAITDAIMRSSKNSEQERSAVRSRLHVIKLDTSLMSSVRDFAAVWQSEHPGRSIDILINNAGISSGREVTEEGMGVMYTTNFLGSFLLTNLLEQHLAPAARVIFTSSTGQYSGKLSNLFDAPRGIWQENAFNRALGRKTPESQPYSDTKLMQIAFAHLLQRRWDQEHKAKTFANVTASQPAGGRIAHTFSPGYTFTEIFDKIPATLPFFADPAWWFLKAATKLSTPVAQGAATGLWLASTDDAAVMVGGRYWDRMAPRLTSIDFAGRGTLQRLWECWERDAGVRWV